MMPRATAAWVQTHQNRITSRFRYLCCSAVGEEKTGPSGPDFSRIASRRPEQFPILRTMFTRQGGLNLILVARTMMASLAKKRFRAELEVLPCVRKSRTSIQEAARCESSAASSLIGSPCFRRAMNPS